MWRLGISYAVIAVLSNGSPKRLIPGVSPPGSSRRDTGARRIPLECSLGPPNDEEEHAARIIPVPRAPPRAVSTYAPMPTASADTSAPGADGSSASAMRCESDESTCAQYWRTR